MKKLQPHPLIECIPDMTDEEFAALRESIENNGQKEPITLFEGKILDGRNRYEACQQLQIKPKTRVYSGHDPKGDVIIPSLARRHLSPAQRAATLVAIRNLPYEPTGKTTRKKESANLQITQSDISDITGASERTVSTIQKLSEEAPELFAKVQNGEMTPHAAAQELKRQEEEKNGDDDKEDEIVLDKIGIALPKALAPVWLRKNEILDLMRQVAAIESTMSKAQASHDPLYIGFDFQAVIIRLKQVHQELKAGQLYALCVTCNGRNSKACKLCKGRGILSKFAWDTYLPEEAKEMRKASAK